MVPKIEPIFSEKLYDSFLSLTFPIYNGAPNISKYFDQNSFKYIDTSPKTSWSSSLEIIQKTINTDLQQLQIKSLENSKDRVLNRYTIWPTIENILAKNATCASE